MNSLEEEKNRFLCVWYQKEKEIIIIDSLEGRKKIIMNNKFKKKKKINMNKYPAVAHIRFVWSVYFSGL